MGLDFGTSIGLKVNGTTVLDGRTTGILKPLHPSFSVYGTVSTAAGNYVIFGSVIYNVGNYYNPANGVFTAPAAGVYCFEGNVLGSANATGDIRFLILKNGTSYNGGWYIKTPDVDTSANYQSYYAGLHIQMAAGDTAGWYFAQGPATYNAGGYTAFGGFLIG